MQLHHSCSVCTDRYLFRDQPQVGFQVIPLTDGTDSVQAAIHRSMQPNTVTDIRSTCPLVCTPAAVTEEMSIDAAPEYLRVILYIFDAAADGGKNTSRVRIDERLDITRYMGFQDDPVPVRYKLTSTVYHRGGGRRVGHYAAGVTSGRGKPEGFRPKDEPTRPDGLQWFCSDHNVKEWTTHPTVVNKVTNNPVNFSTTTRNEGDFNAYVLWYVREVPERAAKVPRTVAMVGPEDSTIAERLLARKRVEREGDA